MIDRETGADGTEPLVTRIEAPANVLLLEPSLGATTDGVCTDLLAGTVRSGSRSTNVLVVTLTRSPAARVRAWETHAGSAFPAEGAIVAVDNDTTPPTPSGASDPSDPSTPTDGETDASAPTGPSIARVASPGDLTNLGIATSERLSEMSASDEPGLVCFHSLTTLLQYADPQRVFRFVHTLGGRARSCGAITHYHLDPTAHDPATVATLEPLFDVAVDLAETDAPTLTALR